MVDEAAFSQEDLEDLDAPHAPALGCSSARERYRSSARSRRPRALGVRYARAMQSVVLNPLALAVAASVLVAACGGDKAGTPGAGGAGGSPTGPNGGCGAGAVTGSNGGSGAASTTSPSTSASGDPGSPCATHDTCGNGQCIDGTCCLFQREPCSKPADCCSGRCESGVCGCGQPGAKCEGKVGACCSELCIEGACACAPPTRPCESDVDCCNGRCDGDKCAANLEGEPCSVNYECASENCDYDVPSQTGTCGCRLIEHTQTCCTAIGQGCSTAQPWECCTNLCDSNGKCACAPGAGACRADEDCCDGKCYPWSYETPDAGKRCCKLALESCSVDADCCGAHCSAAKRCCAGLKSSCTSADDCCGSECAGGTCCLGHLQYGCASDPSVCCPGTHCVKIGDIVTGEKWRCEKD